MRVIYKPKEAILKKLEDAYNHSIRFERTIEKFIVSDVEWEELKEGVIHKGKSRMMYNDIPIEKEGGQ